MLNKKEIKNFRAKKGNSQKPKQKKQHFCHYCGAVGHTRPNCYKWLGTQQSNSMIASGNQNQFPSSAPLGDFLKTLMFLSNLNDLNSSPSLSDQEFAKRKGSSKVWKENGSKSFCHFFSLPFLFLFFHVFCVLLSCFESVQFYPLLCLACFCLVIFQFCFIFFLYKKN